MQSTPEEIAKRWADLEAVAEHYKDFRDFYWDCSVDLLGFTPTEMQLDIANYVATGAKYGMVQAQRGEAKTTITGCYAVWNLIQDPKFRVLIFSAGADMAKEISTWCIQIIYNMDVCEPLRPDKTHPGVRTSVEAFDIHHDLKGAIKSPSIKCLGITANMQGPRADLLIADDIESSKNSLTAVMRELLRHRTRDFTSINSHGQIIYLGTPQSTESIYNDLPARGFTVRIWPGRIPNEEEEANYGKHLAPFIRKMMDEHPEMRTGYGPDGTRGAPSDPDMVDEELLSFKEVDQGKAYFNLQFMLDTALSDADRFPLKLKDLMFYSFDLYEAPSTFTWTNDLNHTITRAVGSPIADNLFAPARVNETYLPYAYKLMAIDPAGGGQNGDETGVAIVYAMNGYYCVMHVTGVPGGTEPGKLQQIIDLAKKWNVDNILVEKNFGYGMWTNALRTFCMQTDFNVGIEEVYNTGQKEKRISDVLEPVIGAHRLVINQDVREHDVLSTNKYPVEARSQYQFLFQLRFLTRERGALAHDDRLEAVAMAVGHISHVLKQHQESAVPLTPVGQFKGLRQDVDGRWRLAHRVEEHNHNRQLNINVLQRFK